MTAIYTNTSTGSQSSFISGNFATCEAMSDLSDNFVGGLIAILDDLIDEATEDLQSEASDIAEWAPYSQYLEVDLVESEILYGYSADVATAAAIVDVEYGTGETSPIPLLRSFRNQNEHEFSSKLSKRLKEELSFG